MFDVDVVVVGGGGAGVAAAAAAAETGARVLVVSKEPLGSGDTRIGEGAVVYPGRLPGDSVAAFARDVYRSGEGLSRPELVTIMAEDGWRAIHDYEQAGATFHRDRGGQFSARVVTHIGGHSVPRSLVCIGRGMLMGSALRAWAARLGIAALEGAVAIRILVADGEVCGVQALDPTRGEVVQIPCRAVILAAGSAGALYFPHTDCVQACTGDGYALALGAGARLVEMEQVQYLPFACVSPAAMVGVFIGDPSLAGPHGVLRDARGEVLLQGVSRHNRAQVVQAMAAVMGEPDRTGPGGGVFLDLSPNWEHPDGVSYMEHRIARQGFELIRRAYGPEAGQGRVPFEVLPTAHYNMGGVLVNADCESEVPGLYAAGATMGGLHGGNRLGSVAMAEILLFGHRAGVAAAKRALAGRRSAVAARQAAGGAVADGAASLPANAREAGEQARGPVGRRGTARPVAVIRRLQEILWEQVGTTRTESGLAAGLAELDRLEATALQVSPSRRYNTEWRDALQLGLMLTTARAITAAALARRETRGAHLRSDYPGREPQPLHTLVRGTGADMKVERAPVPAPLDLPE